jgi:hypothetical protein
MSGYTDLARFVTFRPLERSIHCEYRRSPFSAGWTSTIELLAKELRAHGATNVVLEIDFDERNIRLDGLPRADRSARTPGIVLSFQAMRVPGRPNLRYEVGTFSNWQDNLRAVALGLEALRAVDRHGVTKRGEQYAGWKALPSGRGDVDGLVEPLVRKPGESEDEWGSRKAKWQARRREQRLNAVDARRRAEAS